LRSRDHTAGSHDASITALSPHAMNRAYWDGVAADYEREVLSVFDHDTEGLVRARIAVAGAAAQDGRAADLGCGVGKFTPLLARAFAQVDACDRSDRGLVETRARCEADANVSYWQFDLTCDPAPFAPVEFVLCVNVLIMPSLDERMRAWRAVTSQVAHDGTLLLVVPSLESVQLEHFLALEACLLAGDSCAEAVRRSTPENEVAADLHQGVHPLDGLRTKHYLREELEQMMSGHELDLMELIKLEYRSPAPGAPPWPWDWLAVARRR
jgi:SAM-dependent methyltransferase